MGNPFTTTISAAPATVSTVSGDTYGSYRYLLRETGAVLGYGREPAVWPLVRFEEVDSLVQRGVANFYAPPPLPGQKLPNEWSFLRPVASLAVSTSDYTYDLPSDFVAFDGELTFAPSSSTWYRPIPIVPEHTVRKKIADLTYTGRPEIAGYRPKALSSNAQVGTITIRRVFQAAGSLVDPTSIVLSDSTATYGVKRNDTGAVVVADGTAMTQVSTGIYEYSFTEPEAGLTYTAWVEVVHGGNTYRFEHDVQSPSVATGTGYEILFWPVPDGTYTLYYRYHVQPGLLSDDNATPCGGSQHYQTILASCLAVAEEHMGVKDGPYIRRYLERLAASVGLDRLASTSQTLGVEQDRSDQVSYMPIHDSENVTTYNGVEY